jgi:hypothetical protein
MGTPELAQSSRQDDEQLRLRLQTGCDPADPDRRESVRASARSAPVMPLRRTSRGFEVWAEFPDGYGAICAVRTCAVEDQNGIWVGVEKPRLAFLPLDQARIFRAAVDAAISALEER